MTSVPDLYYRLVNVKVTTFPLGGSGRSSPRPDRFTAGKETRYPSYRRLGEPRERSGEVQKILLSPGFEPRTGQPVTSRCTDRAVTAIYCQWCL